MISLQYVPILVHHDSLCRRPSHPIDTIHNIQPQITKLQQFADWAHMDLNLAKYAITCCPNKSKLKPNTFEVFIQSQQITYKNKNFPTLTQNEP